MAFIDDINTSINQEVSFNGTYPSGFNIIDMKKSGWKESADYLESQSSANVDTNTIASNALASGTEAEWGLNFFKPNVKAALLRGNSLLPFQSKLTNYEKYILIVNSNIYKFNSNTESYFNAVKAGAADFAAAYYLENQYGSGNSYSTSRVNAGQAQVNNNLPIQ
jgi:hypothetical protein